VKYVSIAYFLGNRCAKNYRNQTVYVKIIASQRWDVFLRHGVGIYNSTNSLSFRRACVFRFSRIWYTH